MESESPLPSVFSQIEWFEMQCVFSAAEAGSLPRFLGPSLHGVFGHALFDICKQSSEYSPLLELCYPAKPLSHQKHSSASGNYIKPFLFSIDRLRDGDFRSGDVIEFSLVCHPVLASESRFMTGLQFALERMAKRGIGPGRMACELSEVIFAPSPRFMPRCPSIDVQPTLQSAEKLLKNYGAPPRSCELVIHTPLQIVSRDRTLNHFDPHVFLQRLWQRLMAWSGLQSTPVAKTQIANQIRVETAIVETVKVNRWSSRQECEIEMRGIEGEVTLSGLDAAMWGALLAGEYLHIGKNTTSGFGKYRVYPE